MSVTTDRDRELMSTAARLAVRGHGGAEPNPLVGCVITGVDGSLVGWGYHRRYGGPHAEIHALRRAGDRARGATAYVTLEPCSHEGQTGPCAEALVQAGVARVVIARRDPHPAARGGIDRLRAAGVKVDELDGCPAAVAVSDPFVHRVRTGLPWVVAKWAQTIDGRIATRTGASRWISGERSRRLVHRERGRVDAILTGMGTVRADDPRLTARHGGVRRVARRIVVDPRVELPIDARIVTTAADTPTIVVCDETHDTGRAETLRDAGVAVLTTERCDDGLRLAPVLRRLADGENVSRVLVEGGGRLLGRLFAEHLVNEAWVFIAPRLLGDADAVPCVTGLVAPELTDGPALRLVGQRVRGGDLVLRYRVES